MGYKIFISYKYGDYNVKSLNNFSYQATTVRDYVNIIENKIDHSSNIYKGEHDDEDMSRFKDETIWSSLKDKIFDSSITIVLISPNMKEYGVLEDDQWIPQEISYSLKEMTRPTYLGSRRKSKSNGIIAVVLPDRNGSYSYYIETHYYSDGSTSRTLKTDTLFYILKKNMFNEKRPNISIKSDGTKVYHDESSYIESVKWDDFISNMNFYLNKASNRQNNIDSYDICKITSEPKFKWY